MLELELGSSPSEQPGEVRTAVMGDSSSVVPIGSDMELTLQDSFPWLRWDSEKIQSAGHLSMLMHSMKPNGWLFVRAGIGQFSLNSRPVHAGAILVKRAAVKGKIGPKWKNRNNSCK